MWSIDDVWESPLAWAAAVAATWAAWPYSAALWACVCMAVAAAAYGCRRYNLPRAWRPLGPADTAVVTGGSSGLGAAVVAELLACGVEVVNVDVAPPRAPGAAGAPGAAARFVRCDVGDGPAFRRCLAAILARADAAGRHVSVLVNNAGVDHRSLLLRTPDAAVARLFRVNTLAHVWAVRAVVAHHLAHHRHRQLFIVSVASALAALAPRNLTVYLATKAAVVQIHEGLAQELRRHPRVRMLLVAPGQLDTAMFGDIAPSNAVLAPVVSHRALARQVVRRASAGHLGVLARPLYANALHLVKCLPIAVQDACRWALGIDTKAPST
jgi:NAD(P)-dependent dehydrogenase (short-subunit alcohol dehydrogenase family)